MGVKHFFQWYKTNFKPTISTLGEAENFETYNIDVDNLMIDMNGIFHNSAQKVFKYGNYKVKRLIKVRPPVLNFKKKQQDIYESICESIEKEIDIVKPKKRLILCVDGPAPISKQNQQRQRRFRTAMEAPEEQIFDSNCITPGTKFMDYLTKYIDWYIKNKLQNDPKWQKLEVIFSNEKAVGEGEHKIINYIRNYGNPEDTYCISGMDADLIMLSLVTHIPNLYILREETYIKGLQYYILNIGQSREKLKKMLKWKSDKYPYNSISAIDDFVFICFTTGNDFLPHIPSIEIIESGIELLINICRQVGITHGHLTYRNKNGVFISNKALKTFMEILGEYEKENFERKVRNRQCYFKDEILEKNSTITETRVSVNIDSYIRDYLISSFGEDYNISEICNKYIEGMQWVISYYTSGVTNWKWLYNYHYAPPASVLANYILNFVNPIYPITTPSTTFQQLLCVLPPKSAKLLPDALGDLLLDENSKLVEYCPNEFVIDLAGKRKEWEGIVLLPMVNFEIVRQLYFDNLGKISVANKKRNIFGKSFKYEIDENNDHYFKSYYGDIENCKIKIVLFEL